MQASAITEDRKFQDQQVTPVYTRNSKATKPVVVNVGGADSSKSHSLAQLFIGKLISEKNKTFLICRKTRPALKLTAYRLVISLLKEYGYYAHMTHNKSDLTLSVPGLNNLMVFASIDDPEKYKSAEFNYIWMEEANDFTWDDFIILKLRLRAKTVEGEPNRMYLSCNPSDIEGMVSRVLKEPDTEEIHSTYLDNRFASETDIAVLEGLREQDEAYWLIYAKGKFAKLKGQIYELQMMTQPYPECEEYIYGEDYGFVHPNVLLKIGIDMEHMTLYVTELLYKTGMTNEDLKKEMKKLIPEEDRGREIYGDSAEPDRIEEIYQEGFNIHAADKGPRSVVNGIDCINRFKIVSREENINFNRDMKGYKRKVDRKGIVQEDPVKFRDHGPDALRYPVYTHLRDRLLALDPAWTLHSGQEEEKKPEDQEAVGAVLSDEENAPGPVALAATRGARDDRKEDVEQGESPGGATPLGEAPRGKKIPEPKKEIREDEDWTV